MSYKHYLNQIENAIKQYAIALAQNEPELEELDDVVDAVRVEVDDILAGMADDLMYEFGNNIPVGDIYDDEDVYDDEDIEEEEEEEVY